MAYLQDSQTGYFHPINKIPDWVSNRIFFEVQNGDLYFMPSDEEYTCRYIDGKWYFNKI